MLFLYDVHLSKRPFAFENYQLCSSFECLPSVECASVAQSSVVPSVEPSVALR